MRILTSLAAAIVALSSATAQRMDRQGYVAKYKNWAICEMNRTGIPASITLAQGILESDCGNSDLAVEANNHFGIKCHSDWTGRTMHKDDDRNDECFRSYDNAYQSFKDHSDFLTGKSRYASLFTLDKTDYKGWAKGLKKCGYATERTYAERLIAIIEDEGLHKYDTASGDDSEECVTDEMNDLNNSTRDDKGAPVRNTHKKRTNTQRQGTKRTPRVKPTFSINPLPAHEVKYNNGVQYVELNPSDSFQSIASEFHLMVWELYKYNDLTQDADITKLSYIYLRPKRNRSHPDCKTHEMKRGETLWDVAHAYGVKLSKLEKRNGLMNGETPEAGSIINLR